MNFNVEEAGGLAFKKPRFKFEKWNFNKSVMEVTEKRFIFSKDLCNHLKVVDGSNLTIWFKEDGMYLGNVTGQNIKDSVRLTLSKENKQGEIKTARTSTRKTLLEVFKKQNYKLGSFEYDNSYTPNENVIFPVCKLKMVVTEEMENNNAEEIVKEQVMSGNTVPNVNKW